MQQTITVEREFLSTITTEEMLIRILWAHFRQLAAGPPEKGHENVAGRVGFICGICHIS